MPTSYSLTARFKELTSYIGMLVALIGVLLPAIATPATVIEILTPVGSVIGALLFFLPENRAVLTAEQVFKAINQDLPPEYFAPQYRAPAMTSEQARQVANAGSVVASVLMLGMLAACLSACGAQPAPATATAQGLAQIVQGDLAQAIGFAQGATPPDDETKNCFGLVQNYVTGLQGQAGAVQPPKGVFSAFEMANLALNNATSLVSPVTKTQVENACGPLAMHVQNNALTAAQELVGVLGAIGIKVALPGVP